MQRWAIADLKKIGPNLIAPMAVLQGKLLKVIIPTISSLKIPQSSSRSIKGFTASAHLRMLKFVAKVDWGKVEKGSFITLTYPDQYCMRTRKQRNRDRYLFQRHMEKYLGRQVSTLWRVEWLPRKSGQHKGKIRPHIHMIVFGHAEWQKADVRKLWRKALGCSGPLEVDAQPIINGDLVGVYIGKYCGKLSDPHILDNPAYLNSNGRHWGTTRTKGIPLCEQIVFRDLSEKELFELVKAATTKIANFDWQHPKSFVLLGKVCEDAVEKMCEIGLADRLAKA